MRSSYIDQELMLVIRSKELNAHLREQIGDALEKSAHLLPSGEKEYGEKYDPPTLPLWKKGLYGVLRIVCIPIRHLL